MAMGPPPGSYLMKLEPGAPLPPDLPLDAQRYRLVDEGDQGDREKIALGCVVAMVAAAVVMVRAQVPQVVLDVPFGLAGLAIAWAAWGRWRGVPRYVPSACGDYVVASRSMVAESLGALAAPKRLSMPARIVCGALGAALIIFATTLSTIALAGDDGAVIAFWLISAIVAAYLIWLAVKGERGTDSRQALEIPPSPWFYSLADPSQPLPDDAPISGRQHAGPRRGRPGS